MEPVILSQGRSGAELASGAGMPDRSPGDAPGASTAEEVERTERQPGRKGGPAEKGPSPKRPENRGREGATGTGSDPGAPPKR